MKLDRNKIFSFAFAAVLALALAGCGGGGGGTAEEPMPTPPTPQETCEAAGNNWVDGACLTDAQVAFNMCVAAGGRDNGDGTCTSAADVAAEMAQMIMDAQTAAAAAATAANTALDAAKAAFNAIAGMESYDALHYQLAAGAVNDAVNAKQAADAANQAAMDADTPAAAQAAQADAEAAQVDAEAALANATMFANYVTAAKTEADRLAQEEADRIAAEEAAAAERDKIDDAREAARLASEAASAAATAAATALATLQADADATAHQLVTATTAKIAADAAAQDAADAYAAAMNADTVEAAESARDDAQMAQAVAEAQQGIIDGFNMANQGDRDADDAETQRMADVNAARDAANQSYMDADADATKAEAQADAAEATAPGSPGAMAARNAATAARNAANAAKAAHDAIMDSMTKAEADAEAQKAADAAGDANTSYMTAKAENDAIQTAAAAGDEQQRVRDIADATSAASDAAMAARAAATAARTAATNAENAYQAADAAWRRAVAARTDSDEALSQAQAAYAAAEAAKSAATAAEMAADAAEAAHMGIDPDGSADDAEAAQMTAETEQGKAETAEGTANTEYMTASTARDDAMTAAGTHVLQLFLAANGAHVMDDEDTMVDEKAAHVASVGAALATIANVADGNQTAGTTVAITHPGDTVDNPATVDDPNTLETVENNEFSEGMRTITVTVNGNAIVAEFRETRGAMDLNDDGDTTDPNEEARIQTANEIDPLGAFTGYELWENDNDAATDTDRARAILFTNKQKGDDSVLAVAAATARAVSNAAVQPAELAKVTSTANTITGVEWTPSGETALTGTLTCTGDSCSITLGPNGTVTAITGYTFTGSRAAREAVTAADATEDNDYLAFGIWLEESDDGATDTIGAFAVGGTDYAVNVQAAVTGTAVYTGVAAGAHHKTGEGVNFFSGDASLTADFGNATDAGTVSGSISNIRVNGGPAMSDSIELREADLTAGTATFNGAARMGAGEIQDDDTVDYPYNGTWSGSFFGATANDTDTTDVDESVTAPLAAAGTFGVTRTEDMDTTDTADDVVESFVGAFGANKQ